MDLEVVTVGTELLLGFTLDGNSATIGRTLSAIGCNVSRVTSVADVEIEIQDAVAGALKRTGLVIVTGGLGPTRDDVTKRAVARIFDSPLDVDDDYLKALAERFSRYGIEPMPDANRSQAEIPRGARTLENRRGTAPGLWLEGDPGVVILLPGVPREMAGILASEVVPRLREWETTDHGRKNVCLSRTLRTTGISESKLADTLAGTETRIGDVTLAYLPGVDGVDLRLSIRNLPEADAVIALEAAEEVLREKLGERYYGRDSETLAGLVVRGLQSRGQRIAVAESCTGGLIGARIVDVPGASDVFAGGIICYSNESKIRDLNVPGSLLEQYGAVSELVARAMAEGVCERFGVELGVAVTGIAGPGGGTESKPVGTVCFAAKSGSSIETLERWFPGGRKEVRQRSAQAALDLLRRMMNEG